MSLSDVEHKRLRDKLWADRATLRTMDASPTWKTEQSLAYLKALTDSVNERCNRPWRKFLAFNPSENHKPDADGATRGVALLVANFAPVESHLGGNVRKRHTDLQRDGLISPTMDVLHDALGDLFFEIPIFEVRP